MTKKEPAGGNAEQLLGELRLLAGDVDPVPPEVTSFAHAALGWRRIDVQCDDSSIAASTESDELGRFRQVGRAFPRSGSRALPFLQSRSPGTRECEGRPAAAEGGA